MPFGRAKPADVDATLKMAAKSRPDETAQPTPPDEQLTMRLGGDDDTVRLDRDSGAAPQGEFLRHRGQHHWRLAHDVLAREPQHLKGLGAIGVTAIVVISRVG